MKKYLIIIILFIVKNITFAQSPNERFRQKIQKLQYFKNVLIIGYSPKDLDTSLIPYFKKNNFTVGFLGLTRGENQTLKVKSNVSDPIERGLAQYAIANETAKRLDFKLYFTRAFDLPLKDSSTISKLWNKNKITNDIKYIIADFAPDIIVINQSNQDSNYVYKQLNNYITSTFSFVKDSVTNSENNYIKTRKKFSLAIYNKSSSQNDIHIQYRLGDSINFENKYYNNWESLANFPELDRKLSELKLKNARPFERDILDSLLTIYGDFDEFSYIEDPRIDRKKKMLENLIREYAGITIQANTSSPYFIVDDTAKISSTIKRDNFPYELKLYSYGFKNYDTLLNYALKDSFTLNKYGIINKTELASQPPWLAEPMENKGMYSIPNRADILKDWTIIRDVSYSGNIDNRMINFKEPVKYIDKNEKDTIAQVPIITLPFFLTIGPNIIFPNIKSSLKQNSQILRTIITPNINQKNVNISVKIIQNGYSLDGPNGPISKRDNVELATRDTMREAVKGKNINFNFPIVHKTILPQNATPSNKVIAQVKTIHFGDTLKLNSALRTIQIDGIPNINYHYQPSIVINPDTITTGISRSIGVILKDSTSNSIISDAFEALHVPISKFFLNKLDLNKLDKQDVIMLSASAFNASQLDSNLIISLKEHVARGGKLVLFATSNNIPINLLSDSAQLNSYYRQNHQPNEDLEIQNTKDSIWNYPNRLTSEDFHNWKEVLSYTKLNIPKQDNFTTYLNYKNLVSNEIENGLLVENKYKNGKILVVGLSLEDQLEVGITSAYKLLLNLLY